MKLIAVLLLAIVALSQTRVAPAQIRNWQQLRSSTSNGTAISISQLAISADSIRSWQEHARYPSYAAYRVAVVATQKVPILITCNSAEPGKGECADHFPLWFRLK
jgi:hypothetical protein